MDEVNVLILDFKQLIVFMSEIDKLQVQYGTPTQKVSFINQYFTLQTMFYHKNPFFQQLINCIVLIADILKYLHFPFKYFLKMKNYPDR